MEESFKRRYSEIDKKLDRLLETMQPRLKRTEKEIAQASVEYFKCMVSRWEVRVEEVTFNQWKSDQKEKS